MEENIYYAIHRADRASSLDSNEKKICVYFFYYFKVVFSRIVSSYFGLQ